MAAPPAGSPAATGSAEFLPLSAAEASLCGPTPVGRGGGQFDAFTTVVKAITLSTKQNEMRQL
jgi:hypothetical protein